MAAVILPRRALLLGAVFFFAVLAHVLREEVAFQRVEAGLLTPAHPIVFHTALEAVAPNGWQVEQQPNRLVVRLVAPAADTALAHRRIQEALAALTIDAIAVDVVTVTAMERTRLGKVPLVKALPA